MLPIRTLQKLSELYILQLSENAPNGERSPAALLPELRRTNSPQSGRARAPIICTEHVCADVSQLLTGFVQFLKQAHRLTSAPATRCSTQSPPGFAHRQPAPEVAKFHMPFQGDMPWLTDQKTRGSPGASAGVIKFEIAGDITKRRTPSTSCSSPPARCSTPSPRARRPPSR